jgi:gliding motility-associated-like protein
MIVPITGTTGVNVPSAFSPNADGSNDFLQLIIGPDVQRFKFSLFDRWGNRIIETTDSMFAWDGYFNGKPVNIGVYAYQIEITYTDGKLETKSGNITVVR